MLDRLAPSAATPTLLAGVAVLALALAGARRDSAPPPSPAARPSLALERCLENVAIIHDVYWAAACSTYAQEQRAAKHFDADDSVDCTLPDARAAVLNKARAADEAQCSVATP